MDRLWRNDSMAVLKMVWLRGLELCFVGTLDKRGANLHGMRSILKSTPYREDRGSLRCCYNLKKYGDQHDKS